MHAFAMPSTPTHAAAALDALEKALADERQALLENDADALLRSTTDKIAALRRAETIGPAQADADRVRALGEFNRANAVLLSRRRREVTWALRHLGRVENAGVYDASGQAGNRPQSRCLGVG